MDKVDKGRGIYKQRSARHRRADGEPDRCAVNPLMHWRSHTSKVARCSNLEEGQTQSWLSSTIRRTGFYECIVIAGSAFASFAWPVEQEEYGGSCIAKGYYSHQPAQCQRPSMEVKHPISSPQVDRKYGLF